MRLEAAGCRVGFGLLPRLPPAVLRAASRVAGRCGWWLLGPQRRIALANLNLALGSSWTEAEKRRIGCASFQSFARTSFETLAASRLNRARFADFFEFQPGSLELLKELVARKRGLIALTFHYGNWEWLSLAWGLAGYPVTAVAQPIKNPWVEARFLAIRQQMGHRIVHRRHAGPRLFKTLKRGGIIGLLVDLNSSIEEGGAFFDFFGVPALTTRSVGFLAMKTGAPIVCSVARPQVDGRYRIEIGPEIPFDASAPAEKATDEITRRWLARCEQVVREQPEFWMWMYKRWKARPVPEAEGYPFYSFYHPKVSAAKVRPD